MQFLGKPKAWGADLPKVSLWVQVFGLIPFFPSHALLELKVMELISPQYKRMARFKVEILL